MDPRLRGGSESTELAESIHQSIQKTIVDDNNNSSSLGEGSPSLISKEQSSSLKVNNDVVVPVLNATEEQTLDENVSNEGVEESVAEDEKDEIECGIEIAKKKYAKKLRNRNAINIKRKLTHAGFGVFFALCNNIIPRSKFLPFMVSTTSFTLFMELFRYRKGFGWMNRALHFVLGSALRKQEMEGKFTGSFYYFLGVTSCTYWFPGTPATLGIIQLALADPSASYFGRQTRHIYWSRIENGLGGFGRNKGVLGFLGGALFCVPFNFLILSSAKWSLIGLSRPVWKELLGASFALGVAGAFADLAVPTPALTMPDKILGIKVPPFHVDDNFVVPIFSAYACREIFNVLGWNNLALRTFLMR